jgi:hypothetical protein
MTGRIGLAMALALGCGWASAAEAAVTFRISESAGNVVIKVSGSFNSKTAKVTGSYGFEQSYIGDKPFDIGVGAAAPIDQLQYSLTPGAGTFAMSENYLGTTLGSGLAFGVDLAGKGFYVDKRYANNAAIDSTALFLRTSIDALGFKAGTYTFTVGENAGSIIVEEASAIPEPATWAMMLIGFGMVAGTARYRRKALAVFA